MKWPLTAGITVGLSEAVWLLAHNHKTFTGSEAVLLLVYSAIVYSCLVLLLALFCKAIQRLLNANRGWETSLPESIAIAAGLFIGSVLLLKVAKHSDWIWSVAACLSLAVLAGVIVHRLALRMQFLQTRLIWAAGNVLLVLLGIGITLVITTSGSARDLPATQRDRPNVLLISVDTLRADHLGAYGNTEAQTPNIDQLARSGIVFEQAMSPVPLTGPSHTTMLTGLYPSKHGAVANGIPIRSNVISLPQILSDRGYRTAAFVSGWTLKNVAAGLSAHFDHYDQDFSTTRLLPDSVLQLKALQVLVKSSYLTGRPLDKFERTGESTNQRALKWLNRYRNEPFFLFVHYFDPHSPYQPHDPSGPADEAGDALLHFQNQPDEVKRRILSDPSQVGRLKSLYANEIRSVDVQVGELLSELDRLAIADETIVLFTSDHGESLTEHSYYFDHGEFLYDTCMRVPLLLRLPDRRWAGMRKKEQVRLTDLTPTILELLSIRTAGQMDGKSLMPVVMDVERTARIAFGSIHAGAHDSARSRYYVRMQEHKLIWSFDSRKNLGAPPVNEEYYDLASDPAEQTNVVHTKSKTLDRLRKELHQWIDQNSASVETIHEDVQERLRALGYL